jgi:predicted house-cleaning noncanonical NTP pyrophosphatase (MazG superfamily)
MGGAELMKVIKYDKLVRDRIPEIIRKRGGVPLTHTADDPEYGQKLKEKLREEVKEFLEKDTAEELADILEVIEALCAFRGIDREELERLRRQKAAERGGFRGRVILDEVR